jgi:hypothetical protein
LTVKRLRSHIADHNQFNRGGVVYENATLVHHFLHMSQAQRVGNVPAHTGQHDFQWAVKPLEDLVQGAADQTLAEIKHGRIIVCAYCDKIL